MRGLGRRIRSNFGIGSSRMAIRTQLPWYWRWLANLLVMATVAGLVWWIVQNSYRVTGFNADEARARLEVLERENHAMKGEIETARTSTLFSVPPSGMRNRPSTLW